MGTCIKVHGNLHKEVYPSHDKGYALVLAQYT
jgi:hypothetical protein